MRWGTSIAKQVSGEYISTKSKSLGWMLHWGGKRNWDACSCTRHGNWMTRRTRNNEVLGWHYTNTTCCPSNYTVLTARNTLGLRWGWGVSAVTPQGPPVTGGATLDRKMWQQPLELIHLHQTVQHRILLFQAQAAVHELQWLGMMSWIQEREQKGEAHNEEEKWCGSDYNEHHPNYHDGNRTRPTSKRDRDRQVWKDALWRPRGLMTCRYYRGKGTTVLPTVAAAIKAQTATHTEPKVSTTVRNSWVFGPCVI